MVKEFYLDTLMLLLEAIILKYLEVSRDLCVV